MATTTTYLSLRKPETSDQVNVTTDISANMDLIDAIMTPATPQNQAVGDSASAGSNATVAKSDHKHGMPNFGAPANVASASSNGVATTIARSDHVHAITAGTIVNADISATAEIAVSKLADGNAFAYLQTDSSGNDVAWSTPGQFNFPPTQNASADANTLDDYEEGTWTPSLGGNTTYGVQEGFYTKIGRVIWIQCYLSVTTLGTGSTTTISGLPFTAANISGDFCGASCYYNSLAVNTIFLATKVVTNSATVKFAGSAASSASITNNLAIFGNSAQVQFMAEYHV